MLEPNLQTIAALFVSLVTGVLAREFVGKLFAWLLDKDRALWGDLGGIVGGLMGWSLFVSLVVAMVSS